MSKKLHVLVVFDAPGSAPQNQDFSQYLGNRKNGDWHAEYDVIRALKDLGHQVATVGLYDSIQPLLDQIKKRRPTIIFNLVEIFNARPPHEWDIVALYELLQIPYTGSPPVALMLCKNKGIAKEILSYHRIKTPAFKVMARGHKIAIPKTLKYPLIVKPLEEEASYGISQKSLVRNAAQLGRQVGHIQNTMDQDVLVEEFVIGREIYVGILGNERLQFLPPREMTFGNIAAEEKRFATFKAKWDKKYRGRWGIKNRFAPNLSGDFVQTMNDVCRQVYQHLHITGYARIDLRITPDDEVVVIEANPNPHIAKDEDFAQAAKKAGISYTDLIGRILNLGLHR